MQKSKEEIEHLLVNQPEKALEALYADYYEQMCSIVYRVLYDSSAAEDVVQEIFMEIWKKRDQIVFSTSIYGYLKRACVNRSLNYLRKNKIKFEDETALEFQVKEDQTVNALQANDLQDIITTTVDSLPTRCREVFVLSRYENLTYKEIGEQLTISVKTVENQIAKALKILKYNVGNYMETAL